MDVLGTKVSISLKLIFLALVVIILALTPEATYACLYVIILSI